MLPTTLATYYAEQSPFTAPGRHAAAFDALPHDIEALMEVIQGLVVYDAVASAFYGYDLPEARHGEIHLRTVEGIVDRIMALDDRPLSEPRPVEARVAGRCRNFVLPLIAALRHRGVPARARCGFGAYFNPGYFEDHWVCEYWDAGDGRWKFADPQFDAVWRRELAVTHDVADVPRDAFLVAGDAWHACRAGEADPATFGIGFVDLRGLWFVAGNIVRDIAALNRMELLPWDMWGAQPPLESALDDAQRARFDRLAEAARDPDAHFDGLRRVYEEDDGLRVPETVFNALTNRPERAA